MAKNTKEQAGSSALDITMKTKWDKGKTPAFVKYEDKIRNEIEKQGAWLPEKMIGSSM